MISRNPPHPQHDADRSASIAKEGAKDEARGVADFKPNKNAAKRAGVTPRDLARLEAAAKLEGHAPKPTAKLELATRIDVRDPKGSHRKQAAAKLSASARALQPLPMGAARAKAPTSGALAEPLAALERAVQAFANEQSAGTPKPKR